MSDQLKELHPLERKVLPFLKNEDRLSGLQKKTGLQEVEIMRALQWLENKKIIKIEKTTEETIILDENGEEYEKKELPEKRFLKSLKEKLTMGEIRKKADLKKEELNVCIGLLKKKNAINTEKKDGKLYVNITDNGRKLIKKYPEQEFLKSLPKKISQFSEEEKHIFSELEKRKKIVKKDVKKDFLVKKTSKIEELLSQNLNSEYLENLTPEMLKKKNWKGKNFRKYDISMSVPEINIGKKHFENQVIDYIKKIWLDLGFREMQGNIVQSAFWDLDVLFVPQDHPAREMQDTFYIKKHIQEPNTSLARKIKQVHEKGLPGNKGWGGTWDKETAKKLLLRTHTTVLSARTIYNLKEKELPAKFFSVGKVFRNEALDWKHSFEFYQVEGIVVGKNLNLKHLKGFLQEFFSKMGYPKVRMRPGHFPYTEPSLEVDAWNPEKKEWVELGGSGIFRPEVVVPLFGKEVKVLAWGLGLGRLLHDYGIKDIRDINKNDLKQLRKIKRWIK